MYTSDNLYEPVTLPADLRFKFGFDMSKWGEHFDLVGLPSDWDNTHNKENISMSKQQQPLSDKSREEERKKMS